MHQVIYTEKAWEDLHLFELSLQRRIAKKIHFFSLQKNPLSFAKRLKNRTLGQYRFRIRDYRVLFDADSKGKIYILMILRIKGMLKNKFAAEKSFSACP